MCGKSARTVRSGGGRKRAHGDDYTGTKLETADTAKSDLRSTAPVPDPTIPLIDCFAALPQFVPFTTGAAEPSIARPRPAPPIVRQAAVGRQM